MVRGEPRAESVRVGAATEEGRVGELGAGERGASSGVRPQRRNDRAVGPVDTGAGAVVGEPSRRGEATSGARVHGRGEQQDGIARGANDAAEAPELQELGVEAEVGLSPGALRLAEDSAGTEPPGRQPLAEPHQRDGTRRRTGERRQRAGEQPETDPAVPSHSTIQLGRQRLTYRGRSRLRLDGVEACESQEGGAERRHRLLLVR